MSDNCCGEAESSCCCSQESCCSGADNVSDGKKAPWVIGEIPTARGAVPMVATRLSCKDRLGGWKVRWNIGRSRYRVEPGLYAVGAPDAASPVLVSANYKLTFDSLRQELAGISCWLLILDSKGVNVWCAAGKGTFGTDELVRRIEETGLAEIVSQRKLLLPQLGAPGISAHEVAKRSGFSVVYGPVRASDIKKFLDSGFEASEEMRTVKFTILDRLVLTPVELVEAARKSLFVFAVLFLLNLFVRRQFGLPDFLAYVGAVLIGAVITPILLPFIPGRAFALKGWLLGVIWALLFVWQQGWLRPDSLALGIGYILLLPAVSSYLAMLFTGSSTFTSFSGVIKEMKIAVPLLVIGSVIGGALVLVGSF